MGVVWTFLLSSILSPLSPSLWETARYRLKYFLKGPLNPKQPTKYLYLIVPKRYFCCGSPLLFYCLLVCGMLASLIPLFCPLFLVEYNIQPLASFSTNSVEDFIECFPLKTSFISDGRTILNIIIRNCFYMTKHPCKHLTCLP